MFLGRSFWLYVSDFCEDRDLCFFIIFSIGFISVVFSNICTILIDVWCEYFVDGRCDDKISDCE